MVIVDTYWVLLCELHRFSYEYGDKRENIRAIWD
jgi:hypothetical protein